MKNKAVNKALSALFAVAVAVLIITFSIGLPIYFRPFYYLQIEPLGLPEQTGRSYAQIKEAYDEVLDYLVLPGREFGTGVFEFSESGASHFADCKALFTLNGVALLISLTLTVLLAVLDKTKKIELSRPKCVPMWSYSGAAVLAVFATVGALAATDFDLAFKVFHTLFFPGKDNWVFDPGADEIIMAMPEEFFMNCAILILSSVILLSVGAITAGIIIKSSRARKTADGKRA